MSQFLFDINKIGLFFGSRPEQRDSFQCLGHISAVPVGPSGSIGCGSALGISLASGVRPPRL